jgi:SAM-dependent methyltransferase
VSKGSSGASRGSRREEDSGAPGVFGAYADFYDLLYRGKPYDIECDFVEDVFDSHATAPITSVLDLGCGTGGHAIPLAQRGFEVVGVDRSSEMVSIARRKASDLALDVAFAQSDVGDLDLGRQFDAVLAMFAVLSYQATDEALRRFVQSARRHLVDGGLFLFDFWFGPAVLSHGPERRERVVECGNGDTLLRSAAGRLDPDARTIEVTYVLRVLNEGRQRREVREVHVLRFFFADEIEEVLGSAGFELLALTPAFEVGREPEPDDWNVSVVARAV